MRRTPWILALFLLASCGGGEGGGAGGASATTARVSTDAMGSESNGDSDQPSISSNGRFIAFRSFATNLVAADTNGVADIFVKDMDTGAIDRVSVATGGGQATGASSRPSISGDGRFVAFVSAATDLVAGVTYTASTTNIFLRDRTLATTGLLTFQDTDATIAGNGSSDRPAISFDGAFVAFESSATNLITGLTYPAAVTNVYRRTVGGGVNLVSRDSAAATTAGDGASSQPSISTDGRYVAYGSAAANLLAPGTDTNAFTDVFVRDHTASTTTRVSVTDAGAQATGGASNDAAISNDGQVVAFKSQATNMDVADASSNDIFARTWLAAVPATEHVSVHSSGVAAGNGNSCDDPVISGNGGLVVWHSFSTSLVTGDTNAAQDVFMHNRSTDATTRVSLPAGGGEGNGASGGNAPAISSDGSYVAFESAATNLVTGDANGVKDIFRRGPF